MELKNDIKIRLGHGLQAAKMMPLYNNRQWQYKVALEARRKIKYGR